MNRTGKALLLLLAFVCVIVLIIFSVELFLINSDSDDAADADTTAPAAEVQDDDPDEAPSDEEEYNDEDDPDEQQNEPPEDNSIPTPIGTRFSIQMPGPGEMSLILYANEEQFEHYESELSDTFTYLGSGDASFEIRMIQMQEGPEAFAEDFLEVNFEVEDSTMEGVQPVGNSSLFGILVTGELEDEHYYVWIYSIPGTADLGLALILNYEDETQRSALEIVIDTLVLVPGIVE
jgi:hypothetical protein